VVLPEDEIIHDWGSSNAQDHGKREEDVPSDEDEEADDEPATHTDDVLPMMTGDDNKVITVQTRMLLKLHSDQQSTMDR
jgi:hypothetical protein